MDSEQNNINLQGEKPILIIDDDEIIGDFIVSALATENLEGVYYKDPYKAIKEFRSGEFRAVIVDYKMPDIDGMEVGDKLKSADPEIAMVLLTGFGSEKIAVESLKSNFNYYLTKPIRITDLMNAISKSISEQQIRKIERDYASAIHELYKKKSLALKDLEANYKALFENSLIGILIVDQDWNIISCNKSASGILSSKRNEITQQTLADLVVSKPMFQEITKKFENAGYIENEELEVITAKNEKKSLLCSLVKILDRLNEEALYEFSFYDITFKKRAEEELQRINRLASLGQLSAGIAHEIRNPLGSIKLNIQFLARKYRDDDFFTGNVDEIYEGIERIENIINETLEFSGRHGIKATNENINEIIEKTIKRAAKELSAEKISFETSLSGEIPELNLDKNKFIQVIINLIKNAMDAMENEGTIRIMTALIPDIQKVLIRFEDNGCGIPEKSIEHVFDPFFSTKSSGNGLGLSIIHKIISDHKGSIEVKSPQNEGATFNIYLPYNNITGTVS